MNNNVFAPTRRSEPPTLAVIGAGVAGAACAAALLSAGIDVTLFDKSGGVGGRLATRRVDVAGLDGSTIRIEFDHGCPHFSATRPRFQALLARAQARGLVARWRPRVHARFPGAGAGEVFVPTPDMPAFCKHLVEGVPLRTDAAVERLQRVAAGWFLKLANGATEGPFEHVVLATPAAQAARLLEGHHDAWADALAAVTLRPSWTLMAVTDELDWPWDAAVVDEGPLAWVSRNDRKPGRDVRSGAVPWVAEATAAWSLAHLEEDPLAVTDALCGALAKLLPGAGAPRWHHAAVHRWRYARVAKATADGSDCWWNADLALGVCGDSFGEGTVESAWCSGDELADTLIAALDPDIAGPIDHAGGPKAAPRVTPTEPARLPREMADSNH